MTLSYFINRADQQIGIKVLLAVSVMAAMIAGVVASTGNLAYAGIFIGILIGTIIALSPVVMLWIAIVSGLVIAGFARLYFPEIQQVRWLVIPVSAILAVHSVLSASGREDGGHVPRHSLVISWSMAFLGVALLSTVINKIGVQSAIIGLKGYFQVWGLLFALAYVNWQTKIIDSLPKVVFWVAILQLPAALHQYLVLVPQRAGIGRGIIPVDVIAGTFGADVDAGGANAALSAFLIIVLACLTALWKYRQVSTTFLLLVSGPLLLPVFVNESKVSILYLLIAFIVIYSKDIVEKPLRFAGVGFIVFLLLGAMMTVYALHAPEGKVNTLSDLIEYTYSYNIDKDTTFEGKLSRGGAIAYWVDEHGSHDILHTLLGHGVGVSRVENTGQGLPGEAVSDEVGIGNTAGVAILWEFGVLGLIVIVVLFWVVFRTAGQLKKMFSHDPWHTGLFAGIQAAVGVLFISLWHKNFFIFHVGYQTVVILIFGYIAYWEQQLLSGKIHDKASHLDSKA